MQHVLINSLPGLMQRKEVTGRDAVRGACTAFGRGSFDIQGGHNTPAWVTPCTEHLVSFLLTSVFGFASTDSA
jgi:hypothetical protein